MTLRLVHPAPGGNGDRTPPPRRPKRVSLTLTPEEDQHLRAFLSTLRTQFGSWPCVAEVTGLARNHLINVATGTVHPSPGVALRAARVAGVPVESVLSGKVQLAGYCPTCGAKQTARAVGGAR